MDTQNNEFWSSDTPLLKKKNTLEIKSLEQKENDKFVKRSKGFYLYLQMSAHKLQ